VYFFFSFGFTNLFFLFVFIGRLTHCIEFIFFDLVLEFWSWNDKLKINNIFSTNVSLYLFFLLFYFELYLSCILPIV
jgi:hypothetical protein